MAKTPTSVTIRSYQVGFGDCFLLQFHYDGDDVRNVLIDFGTTGLPKSLAATPSQHMPRVAALIAAHCGRDLAKGSKGKLHAVVATHRHQDHISGFAIDGSNGGSGKTIRELEPDVVVQPWTEDPNAAELATHASATIQKAAERVVGFQRGLSAMHGAAAAAVAFAEAELAKGGAAALSARTLAKLQFVGEDNVKNLSAVRNLIDMGRRKGATAVYASYGSPSGLEDVLPGVKVTVLGPPTLEQTDGIKTMRARDKNEFWQLLSGPPKVMPALLLAHGLATGATTRGDKAIAGSPSLPSNARWFARRLAALRGAQILEIVTSLDEEMNNTSVILLFEFGGRKLLFPGDAQLENWRYALEEVGAGKEAERNVTRLSDIDLYKVGHHGSLNATPKQMLWAHLTRRKAPGAARLRTMMSTMPGKHPGKVGGIGEVPRKPLVQALEDETVLANTDELKKSKDPAKVEWFQEVTIDAVE
jgi:L-ascorbate metabolism protein UlaG (beta-lactamase superfamily)